MQLKILWVGKTRSAPLQKMCTDYLDRMRHLVPCRVVEIADISRRKGLRGPNLRRAETTELSGQLTKGSKLVVLDEGGSEFSSREFASWFQGELNRGTRAIAFVIGGAEGIGLPLLRRADLRLSLGRMTWTHEMTRVLLLEQIYRAFSILNNSPYHR